MSGRTELEADDGEISKSDYGQIRALADFRFALRRFLHFSEEAALRAGLMPQQHQLLLQIAGAPKSTVTAIAYLADRMALRHNSVVELSTRCEEAGLIARTTNPLNRRQVVLKLTAKGNRMLRKLTDDHSCELNQLGPQLVRSLEHLNCSRGVSGPGKAQL